MSSINIRDKKVYDACERFLKAYVAVKAGETKRGQRLFASVVGDKSFDMIAEGIAQAALRLRADKSKAKVKAEAEEDEAGDDEAGEEGDDEDIDLGGDEEEDMEADADEDADDEGGEELPEDEEAEEDDSIEIPASVAKVFRL